MVLYEEIIYQYRCSQIIQSDNGLEFVNEIVRELLNQFQIWHQTVSPYRPQANSMIKRFNRTLREALFKLKEVYDWDKFMKLILMIYNHPLETHRGAGTIVQKIRERYYWETVYQDCKEHEKTCREC